jgi:hypothetical protein
LTYLSLFFDLFGCRPTRIGDKHELVPKMLGKMSDGPFLSIRFPIIMVNSTITTMPVCNHFFLKADAIWNMKLCGSALLFGLKL